MKLRLAKKILNQSLETGIEPRGDTLRRAVSAHPRGSRTHPKKYWSSGITAAFIRKGYSIHDIRFSLESARIIKDIETTSTNEARR